MLHWFLRHTLISRNYLYLLSLLSVSSVLPHPIPPLYVVTEHQAGLPVLFSSFLLTVYFTPASVFISISISQFVTSSPPPIHISFLYVCISIPDLEIGSSIPFFKCHIYASIYNIETRYFFEIIVC